jgi:hypothetical protein
MLAYISYTVGVREIVKTDVQNRALRSGGLCRKGASLSIPHNPSPAPAILPVVMNPDDVILLKVNSLFVEQPCPPFQARQRLGLGVGVEIGTVTSIPYPVGQWLP